MRLEQHNPDGEGMRDHRVYDLPPSPAESDYWLSVTDVPCPVCGRGMIRWAEAGYVPGYRICNYCGRHYLAKGTRSAPTLVEMEDRRDINLRPDEALELGRICTRDTAGRHFTEWANHWERLEALGLIRIHRPVHDQTGTPYSQQHWTVEVLPAGEEAARPGV